MKINLLPGRVRGKSSLQPVWALVVLLILAELGGLAFYQSSLLATEKAQASELETKNAKVTEVNKIGQEATTERSKIRDIDAKVKFVKDLTEYNEVRPDLYANTIEYTLDGIRYTSMSASQNLMQIGAWAPTLSDAGRYLLFMQNSPDFTAVQISGVPGYPPGGQTGGGAAGGPGESGAFSGNSGGPSAGAFPNSGGGFGPGGPSAGAFPNSGGGFEPGGQGAAGGFGGGPGSAFGPGAPGGGGQGGGGGQTIYGGAYQNAGTRNLPPKPPQGFPFTVTAQLVKPIVRPLFGVNPQQPGFGGGYGAPGAAPGAFMPGAFPGGPGGPEPGAPMGPAGPAGPAGAEIR
jgi:hypothetical protein